MLAAIHNAEFIHRPQPPGPERGSAVAEPPYRRRMSTELPADRLRRRLGSDPDTAEDDAPDTSLSRWLPADEPSGPSAWLTRIRADPGRAGVIALGVVGVVAVLVTVLTLIGDSPPAVVSAKLPPVDMASSAAPGAPAPAEPVVVSVVGLVHTPGLVTLPPGSRIADALDAAGGALDGADMLGLNMARRVADGEQIVVGLGAPPGQPTRMGSAVVADAGSPGGGAMPENSPGSPGLVDLNSATVEQLDTLPGVGPVTAAAIVAWRDANGRFTSVDQLGDVDGIGPARLDKLRDLVRV
ncbi:helix-hairpin-helix repeat-containing competence protein ComEA [Mycolicibacterium gilvum]|uniref:Helix-hairpin-helix repeat-containing competence protein ComEA n=3 Tax=Mycolicibacterium gilvum TaxID=1804 RepID=A0A378ST44_9MYCO|nr:helix-hairpin-helix repeat-containing competence protein ComEA [Mycolicibacterium gilvum]